MVNKALFSTLLFVAAVGTVNFGQAMAAEGNQKTQLRKILARQRKKGRQLNVYLRDSRRIYVNGTQLSLDLLATIIRKSAVRSAVVTAERQVSVNRVQAITNKLRRAGLKNIKVTTAKRATPSNERLLKILARQKKKGDRLQVYLRDARHIYVNGTKIPLSLLPPIVTQSGAKSAMVTYETIVPVGQVWGVTKAIRKTGLRNVQTKVRR